MKFVGSTTSTCDSGVKAPREPEVGAAYFSRETGVVVLLERLTNTAIPAWRVRSPRRGEAFDWPESLLGERIS